MMYKNWGFSQNPFDTSPLPASEAGEKLLAGRSKVLEVVKSRILNGPKITTIEGLNGIGKTSIANVASYQVERDSLLKKIYGLYLPCRKTFQLNGEKKPEDFKAEVLREVIQTLIERRGELPEQPGKTQSFQNGALERWLNSTEDQAFQAGFGGFVVGWGRNQQSGGGFESSGFSRAAEEWLRKVFPSPVDGGVICIIDNLELLKTSEAARQVMEELRDVLFVLPGIRWIMCGALGVVRGVASSPRLEGYLHRPVEVKDLAGLYTKDLFTSRIEAFREREGANLPVSYSDFEDIYSVYDGNIRSVLHSLDEYCCYIEDCEFDSLDDVTHVVFPDWLDDESDKAFKALEGDVGERELRTLAYACSKSSPFRFSDYGFFEFTSQKDFRHCITALENSGVLQTIEFENDSSRKYIQVSAKGLLVRRSSGLRRFQADIHATHSKSVDN